MVSHRMADRGFGSRKDHERRVKTICRECMVGCGLVAYLKDGRIVDLHGDRDRPVSRGRLCAKGIAFVQGLRNPGRIVSPGYRKRIGEPFGGPEEWEAALDLCAESLRKIRDQHGPESIVIGSDRDWDLEFAVGAARFARRLGTPHLYLSPGAQSAFAREPRAVPPSREWGKSRCIFFIEADMAVTHTVGFGWALEAQRRGAILVAADARFTRTMSRAHSSLTIRPRSGNLVGLALAKILLEEAPHSSYVQLGRWADEEKRDAFFEGLEWQELEGRIGLDRAGLKKICDLLRENSPVVIVTGRDLSALPHCSIWSSLAAGMGGAGAASGWYPLHPAAPPLDPCLGMEGEPDHPVEDGPPLKEVLASSKAVLCSGNFLGSRTPSHASEDPLVVSFGPFPNATTDLSQLVLPSTLWPEESGLCFSADQEILWGEQILEKGGECRSSLELWAGLARRFGWEKDFPWINGDGAADPAAFAQWLLENSPGTRGCKWEWLRGTGGGATSIFWPFDGGANRLEAADPIPIPARLEAAAGVTVQDDFPLHFQKAPSISRSEESGEWWPGVRDLEPEDGVQIHPETAWALDIETGDEILVTGPVGSLRGRAWLSRMVPRWMVSAPMNSVGERVRIEKPGRPREETLNLLKELLR